jgi:hypothetical protein
MLKQTLLAAAAAVLLNVSAAGARAPLADVTVTDRSTGETLPVYWHRGERWIAGTPGNRYSITVRNGSGTRLLAVLSVDGINAISGETAAWDQAGYVLGPQQSAEVRGWRKSQARIAAFEFTALPDSYAARTGRPQHVGVIGVALFREAPPPAMSLAPEPGARRRDEAPAAPAAESQGQADKTERAASRLGTGHGRSESSYVELTRFERAQPNPDQVLTIRYDSRANLIAMGIIAAPPPLRPDPFPGALGFVPDPPRP